jgi:phosphotransferase system enzyme I (PtsI)
MTKDGKMIKLYANIGNSKDLALVKQNDADGIGLLRSEFLYLEKEDYPTEEEQFNVYRTVAETMAGKSVIIRTLDIGADKQAAYFDIPGVANPAMGYRAIRICLDRPEIFKTQLRAIFRASAYGNLSVMYPMIISVDEVKQIKLKRHQTLKML